MAIETLAVAETKSFKAPSEIKPTAISVSIPGAETDGSFDLLCPGITSKVASHPVTDAGPTAFQAVLWGTVFSITNTGSSALEVDTNATLEP
jgi:hypothetical protein